MPQLLIPRTISTRPPAGYRSCPATLDPDLDETTMSTRAIRAHMARAAITLQKPSIQGDMRKTVRALMMRLSAELGRRATTHPPPGQFF